MTWALGHLGWTQRLPRGGRRSGVVLGARRSLLVLHDTPDARHLRGPRLSLPAVRASLAASWAHPGTRLGLLDALLDPVQRHRADAAVGLPVLRPRRGRSSQTTAGAAAHPAHRGRHGAPARRSAGSSAGHPWHRSTMVLVIVWAIVAGVDRGARLARARAATWLLVVLVLVVGRRWAGLDDRVRPRPHLQPRGPAGERQRDHQPGRVHRQPGARRSRSALVLDWRTPGDEHGVHAGGVPLGDERPVRPLGASAWSRSGATGGGRVRWSTGRARGRRDRLTPGRMALVRRATWTT